MFQWHSIGCSLSILVWLFPGSIYASDAASPDERSLEKAVSHINEQLTTEYALLEPAPMTVDRFREAVKAAIETLAKSDAENRIVLVTTLQSVLAEEHLPNDVDFQLIPTTAKYKEESLAENVINKKVVTLNYTLSIPTPASKADRQLVGLTSLAETYRIVKLDADASE